MTIRRRPGHAARRRRGLVIALSLAAAVAVHALGLGLMGGDGIASGAVLGSGAAASADGAGRMAARPVPMRVSQAAAPPASVVPGSVESHTPEPAVLAAAASPAIEAVPGASSGFLRRDGQRVYDADEVDVAASPQPDWNIDFEAAERLGAARVSFDVIVSDTGAVLDAQVRAPSGADAQAVRELEAALRRTVLKPAMRQGRAVASLRHIELRLAADPLGNAGP